MKQNLLRIVIGIFISLTFLYNANAQWVSIPDTNFGKWLNIQGYSQCIQGNSTIGWQMDTTCPTVVNALKVHVTLNNIRDLTGIAYFDNLDSLVCDGNLLDNLPALPAGLSSLSCMHNSITTLPVLPAGLSSLVLSYNQCTTIPPLPSGLTLLACPNNYITSIQPLPSSLSHLECPNNFLDSLPPLPTGLSTLICSNNHLIGLPALPSSLTHLTCSLNPINSLPLLPLGLTKLECESNQLSSLPLLPPGLKYLMCGNNQLTTLPSLPSTLLVFYCSSNQIVDLPPLPAGLSNLTCTYNQIQSISALPDSINWVNIGYNPVSCLPKLTRINTLFFNNTNVTCLPNLGKVTNSVPSLNTLPICDIVNPNQCDIYWNIGGTAYLDDNNNCIVDSSERKLINLPVKLSTNTTFLQETSTIASGTYGFQADTGSYIVNIDTSGFPFYFSCPSNGTYFDTIRVGSMPHPNKNFGLLCKPYTDLAAWSVEGRFRNASISKAEIHVGSSSSFYGVNCSAGIAGSVTIKIDGPTHYISPAPGALTPNNVIGNTLTYNIPDFGTVDFNTSFNILVATDTSAPNGDTICFTVDISTTNTDIAPANNTLTACFFVVRSYDPNIKEVYPIGDIDATQEWLTYTIHFQNTGTDTALNIYVDDTLSVNLNPSGFQLLSYSHNPLVQLKNNAIRFNFPNINLPDSNNNEPQSHGFVQYKVKLKNNLAIGTQIKNNAFIYFDFNAPVVTNTVTNTIITNTALEEINEDFKVAVYPNPAANILNIDANGIQSEEIAIVNINGQRVIDIKRNNTNQIDISGLPPGVYVALVKLQSAFLRVRWIKI